LSGFLAGSAGSMEPDTDVLKQRLGRARWKLAVAESLTGGLLASHFARREDASDWFLGGVVAYQRSPKERLLGIGEAPVVSSAAAASMAAGAADLFGAAVAVAVTGVGGPGPEDGVAAGTVWIAVRTPAGTSTSLHRFPGSPDEVCGATVRSATELLLEAVSHPWLSPT
jgi:nicotinamide-nucleotide amidase